MSDSSRMTSRVHALNAQNLVNRELLRKQNRIQSLRTVYVPSEVKIGMPLFNIKLSFIADGITLSAQKGKQNSPTNNNGFLQRANLIWIL